MEHPKRVLVTGASGFIGNHVVYRLLEMGVEQIIASIRSSGSRGFRNPRVAWIGADISDPRWVKKLIYPHQPDAVIHLASNPIVKLGDGDLPTDIINDNIASTHNLLAYAPLNCVFINASSATVYGEGVKRIGGVEEYHGVQPNSVYGATKAASEHLVNVYTEMGRVRGVNLRLVANVGTHATHGVLKDIIAKLRSDNPNLELLGDKPGSCKPFIYARDTAQAFWLALTNPKWHEQKTVNLSSDTVITVEQLARIVMFELQIHKPIVWLGEEANWKGDNRTVNVNCRTAKSLGWNPQFPKSEDAVRQAVRDIISLEKAECNPLSLQGV